MSLLKSRKFIVGVFAVVFAAVTALCFVSVFSVKEVRADFSVSEKRFAASRAVQEELNSVLNRNILFVDLNEVGSIVEKNPYFKVTRTEKKYPHGITVVVEERQECFALTDGAKTYILDKDGFCLAESAENAETERPLIKITCRNLTFENLGVGKTVALSDARILPALSEMCSAAGLTDCIEKVILCGKSQTAVFETKTGVNVYVSKYLEHDGASMTAKAFDEYHSATDFDKTFHRIYVLTKDSGEMTVTKTDSDTFYE